MLAHKRERPFALEGERVLRLEKKGLGQGAGVPVEWFLAVGEFPLCPDVLLRHHFHDLFDKNAFYLFY